MALLLLVLVSGCDPITGGFDELGVQLRVSPTAGQPGDTIHFEVFAFNSGDEPIRLSDACGSPADIRITTPAGTAISVLAEMPPPEDCGSDEDRILLPSQLKSIVLAWRSPPQRGLYRVRAGLRRGDGLWHLTPPLPLEIY